MKRKTLDEKFWPYVAKADGCWLWTGGRSVTGYGRISHALGRDKAALAHRVSWLLHSGEIPEGLFVCHHCDTPLCVNPAHLFLGTATDNAQDMVAKGRQHNVPSKGTRNGRSKLVDADVREIRRLWVSGRTVFSLARSYAVSRAAIQHIIYRKQWRHVA